MADYPPVLYNPQRPNAPFTYASAGQYLTPRTDIEEYASYETVFEYVLTGTGRPTGDEIREAQTLLNKLYSSIGKVSVNGQLDNKTVSRVVEFQLIEDLLPTGVPTGETLSRLRAKAKGEKESNTGAVVVGLLLVVAVARAIRG